MDQSEAVLTNQPALVSIVIPAFNEEEILPKCIEELTYVMNKAGYRSEIIVVNDGSTDNTLFVAQSMRGKYAPLRVLDLKRNYGKTIAIREGVRASKGDAVAFFDADLQYNPEDLVKLVRLANNGTDVVNGRRDYQSYGQTRTRLSMIYNTVLRLLFRVPVSDSNCGMKVLRRRAADPEIFFKYGLPLMVPLQRLKGFKFGEVPVLLRSRGAGESKFFKNGSFLGGWRNIKDISYHSGMLLGLLASLPTEWLRSGEAIHVDLN